MKRIVWDGGKEFLKAAKTLESAGIDIDKSARYTTQENGGAEWINRMLKNSLRVMFINSGAPANYWAEKLYSAVGARNRIVRRWSLKTS